MQFFCLIAAVLYASRFLAAAIFMTGLSSWSHELFEAGLNYIGSSLLTLSVISLVVGVVYLVWAELKGNGKNE